MIWRAGLIPSPEYSILLVLYSPGNLVSFVYSVHTTEHRTLSEPGPGNLDKKTHPFHPDPDPGLVQYKMDSDLGHEYFLKVC